MRNTHCFTTLIRCAIAFAAIPLCYAQGVAINGDFEKGIAGWKGYYQGRGDASVLTQSDDAHTGKASLKVQTPGAKPLEGAVFTVRGLELNKRYRIAAWVKGSGTVMLAANCGGWTYGPKKNLTGKWEQHEISVLAKASQMSLDIITIGKKPEKATFWIDDVEVVASDEGADLPAADVPPTYFEAEDYPHNAKIVEDPSAYGGKAAQGARWYVFMGKVPFPQTNKLVTIYIRARIESGEKEHPFCLRKVKQTIQKVSLPKSGEWVWVRFRKPASVLEFGKEFAITLTGPDKTIPARVDGCVVSTDPKLTDRQLDAAAKAKKTGALFSIGRTAEAPKIDGRLEDLCWKNAIEIAPFTVARSESLATEQTRAYAARDAKNLYLAFHCEARVLNPINNQLDAFQSKVTENDKSVIFKDDFVAVLLDTDGAPQTFYDMFINANGAVNDAKCATPDLWNGRDTNWNANATVAAHTGNGFWSVEIAIPFASIGGTPGPGALWHVCLGRNNQAQKETSSWMPLTTGFHNPDDFAAAQFLDAVPAARDLTLGEFARGDNEASISIAEAPAKSVPRLELTLTPPKASPRRFYSDRKTPTDDAVRTSYEVGRTDVLKVRTSILDAATLTPWFRSPLYTRSVQSNVLKADLKGAGATLYVNGKKAGEEAPLIVGENVLAIETPGAVSGAFQVKDHTFAIDDTWLASESATDGWHKTGFDAKGWKPVSPKGWAGGKAYLRKRLLVSTSRFWPNWYPHGIHLAENTVQQLNFVPEGVKGARLSDFRLVVEVPAPLRILGASSYYDAMKLDVTPQGEFTHEGKKWTRTEIAFPGPIKHRPGLRRHQTVSIPVDIPTGAGAAKPSAIRYYVRAESGHVSEAPRTLKVNMLPPVDGRQPKKIVVQMWGGYLSRLDDPELRRSIVETMVRCGVNEMPVRPEGIPMRKFQLIDFNGWNLNMRPWLDEHPEDALVEHTGQKAHDPENARRNHVCTTLLLGDTPAWDYTEKEIARFVEKRDPDHINWDYESDPTSSYISCYCPRCLDAFRKFAGLGSSAPLSPDSIKKQHADPWMRFMLQRFAEMAGKINQAAKKAKPGVVFSVYSGYQSQRTFERYGVDWSLLADKIDLAMCGYGRPLEEIEATLKALGDTPAVFGKIVRPYRLSDRTYPGFASHATLLRRAIDSTGGVLIYTLTELDGRTFHAIGETSRLVAEHEEFFLKNQRADNLVTLKRMNPGDCAVLVNGNRRLVILLNENAKDASATLTHKDLPKGATVYDFYGGKSLGNAASHQATVPAQGAAAFIVAPHR